MLFTIRRRSLRRVNVLLQSRPLRARGRVCLEVHRCLYYSERGRG